MPYSRTTGLPFQAYPPSTSTTSSAGTTAPRSSRYAYAWMYPWLNSRRNGSNEEMCPRSYRTLCQNRAYSRCSTACSTPPTYRSTPPQSPDAFGPIQYRSLSGSTTALSFVGSR